VLEVIRQRLEFPALRRRVVEVHRHVSRAVSNYALLIENKGSGMSLVQDLRRDGVHAIAVDPSGDKVMRMNAQTARIEAGSVVLPRRAPWLDEFRRELMAFPAGRYDDQVDALSQGLQRAFDYQPCCPYRDLPLGLTDGRLFWDKSSRRLIRSSARLVAPALGNVTTPAEITLEF
jgi:predicted phage terminase large subunit-like protein